MPFSRFCCPNHKKYFSNLRGKYEIVLQQQAIKEFEKFFKYLKDILSKKNINRDQILKKVEESAKRMESLKNVKKNIDVLVKEHLQGNPRKKL